MTDGLHWDVLALYSAAMHGLGQASREDPGLVGAAVDSWAVDYGLLRGARLLGNPYHYRDARNEAGVAAVHAVIGPEELFRRNGLQHLPFNTVFQLAAAAAVGELDDADRLLLIPDLIGFWATGRQVAERTNASTTGLLPVGGADWDRRCCPGSASASDLLPDLVAAGDGARPGDDGGAGGVRHPRRHRLQHRRLARHRLRGRRRPDVRRRRRLHLLRHVVARRRRAAGADHDRGRAASPASPTRAASTAASGS